MTADSDSRRMSSCVRARSNDAQLCDVLWLHLTHRPPECHALFEQRIHAQDRKSELVLQQPALVVPPLQCARSSNFRSRCLRQTRKCRKASNGGELKQQR
jgi:hypothetical protein